LSCLFLFFSQSLLVIFVIFMLKLYLDVIMGRQLNRLMPLWQPENILQSVLIFMLLWSINIVVVVWVNWIRDALCSVSKV